MSIETVRVYYAYCDAEDCMTSRRPSYYEGCATRAELMKDLEEAGWWFDTSTNLVFCRKHGPVG